MEQGSQEWIDWRRSGIGASDVAPLMGILRYSTPYKIWSEKVGLSTGFAGNFATQRGTEMEAKARSLYEFLEMEDMPPALAIHPKWDFCRVSLDGFSSELSRVLEIKVPGKEAHSIAMSGQVPDWYIPQVQYQLAVTGANELHYLSLGPDDTHALIKVSPNLDLQAEIIVKVQDFWKNHILAKVPPPLTEEDDKVVNDEEVVSICDDLVKKKDEMKKADIDSLKKRVIDLGGHSRVRCGRVLITRSKSNVYRLTIGKETPA